MNTLEVISRKSIYVQDEHPTIIIDGTSLDELLQNAYPDQLLRGLIPMIVDWMDSKEAKLVVERFYSDVSPSILPVLMCPDDCDLSCTIIVAEVIRSNDKIIWNRTGYDNSECNQNTGMIDIGTKVKWFDKVNCMIFDRETYYTSLGSIYTLHIK